VPGQEQVVSYAEAADCCRTLFPAPDYAGPDNPLSALVRGLAESAHLAAHARCQFPLNPLREDLSALLRVPLLLFYLQVTDTAAFFAGLEKMASLESFPLVAGGSESRAAAASCPACGSRLAPHPHSAQILRCGTCRQALEIVRALPMVSGVQGIVSYEMLRRMVAMDLVVSYQEEGNIRPL